MFYLVSSRKNKKADKNMVNDIDYEGIEFPVSGKDSAKLKGKIIFASMYFVIHFSKYCLQCFSSKRFWQIIGGGGGGVAGGVGGLLKITGKQTVKLRSGSIKFKNHFKRLSVPFKIYADFECNVKGVRSSDRGDANSYTEKYQAEITCSSDYTVVCVDDKFSKPVIFYKKKKAIYRFIEAILEEYDYCKKVIKKHFSKYLIMSAVDEERFQLSNIFWICDKLPSRQILAPRTSPSNVPRTFTKYPI